MGRIKPATATNGTAHLTQKAMQANVLKAPSLSQSDTVAQASLPASSGSVPLPGSTPVGTTGQPAAGTAALREDFTLPNVADILGKFGGADQLRNAVNQLQTLLHAA